MSWKAFSVLSAASWLLAAQIGRADFESQLLQRFQNKNQSAADKLKQDVAENLARAASTGDPEPKKYLERLQANLRQLQDDSYLPKTERDSLIEQVNVRVQILKEEVAKLTPKVPDLPLEITKAKEDTETDVVPRERRRRVAPIFNSQSSFQVTPVVSPGRRWVRIGISGGFSGFGLRSAFVNTTVSVPDGGTVVVGGLGTVSEGRSEFGPPGLSNVPYVSRLFKNVGYSRRVSRTSISASVRIIDLHEEEELFLRSGGR
jgi:hypothetical protein